MSNWDYFFWYGSVFSPVIPLLFIGKKYSRYQLYIISFIILSFSTDLITTFLFKGNNSYILQSYGFLEAGILLGFYNLVLEKPKKWFVWLIVLFLTIYFVDAIWLEPNKFNTIGRSAESFLMIFLSLRLFYQFFVNEDDIFIDRSPLFWINIAILTYFTGAFFSFILSSFILVSKPIWILHNLSNMLKNIILAVGLWRVKAN